MEENVWVDNKIFNTLNEEYVLISLYIDDRATLPNDQQFNYKFEDGYVKTIETIGEKWGTFQSINFQNASQPYYVLLSPDLRVLNTPEQVADPDVYYQWLQKGLERHKQLSMQSIFN